MADIEQADTGADAIPLTITWEGIELELVDGFPWMAHAVFAQKAAHGGDLTIMEDLAVTMDFLEQLLKPEAWDAYKAHAIKIRASGDACLELIGLSLEAHSRRPTVQPSDSSDGLPATKPSSQGDSSSRVMAELSGRPDLQRQVARAQQMQKQAPLHAVG